MPDQVGSSSNRQFALVLADIELARGAGREMSPVALLTPPVLGLLRDLQHVADLRHLLALTQRHVLLT